MPQTFVLYPIILHFISCLLLFTFLFSGKMPVSAAQILPTLLIPVFGPIATLTASIAEKFSIHKPDAIASEFQGSIEDPYWITLRAPKKDEEVVPLEEALIINDRGTRKGLVFDTLLEDPLDNIDILLLARENNDADTAHYANTTISKIQRDFQLQIQKLAVEIENSPDNIELLDRYIHTLDRFINSGLSEAYLLRKQRIILSDLLDRRLQRTDPDRLFLDLKIQNCIALGEINEASRINNLRIEKWPRDEKSWLNELQISVASRDAMRLKQVITHAESADINWTENGREKIAFWREGRG